jgi:hypothetical protein
MEREVIKKARPAGSELATGGLEIDGKCPGVHETAVIHRLDFAARKQAKRSFSCELQASDNHPLHSQAVAKKIGQDRIDRPKPSRADTIPVITGFAGTAARSASRRAIYQRGTGTLGQIALRVSHVGKVSACPSARPKLRTIVVTGFWRPLPYYGTVS